MFELMDGKHIALLLDLKLKINQILRDDLGALRDAKINDDFISVISDRDKSAAKEFLREAGERRISFEKRLSLANIATPTAMFFTAGIVERKILIVATDSKEILSSLFFDEILRINNELINSMRGYYKEKAEQERIVHRRDDSFYENLTRLNNDLIATQRQLFKENEERKRIEEELKKSKEQLADLNSSKDKFFSILSHDLRSPFSGLIGLAEYLRDNADEVDSADVKEVAEVIRSSSEKVFKLLENLLQWSRLQTGSLAYNPSEFDVYELIFNNVELLKNSAKEKKIALDFDSEVDSIVFADYQMIDSTIRNLITNAIKFTPEDGRISVKSNKTKGFIEISVSDTGIGMTPIQLKKLFKIDVHFVREGTNAEKGSGLGLILCKEFVEKNGGNLRVESSEKTGTKVSFTLPEPGSESD